VKNKPLAHSNSKRASARNSQRGAALATAVILLAVVGTIGMTVLAVVHTETRIAGSDFKRTQAFYAATAGIEKMTSDFSDLFYKTSRPTAGQLTYIQNSPPPELLSEGYTLTQEINVDSATLAQMRQSQNITDGSYPNVTVPTGPFNGLKASIEPYILTTTARAIDGTEVRLRRQMNNYLIPLFQFGMFSDADLELHPGPAFSFNGRVHANGNIYANGNVTFLAKVTTANEFIYDVVRNGATRTGANVSMKVGSINVRATMGSMNNGPNISGALAGQRGYFPGSPNGTANSSWNTSSVAAATTGVNNQFGGQLLTRTTGGARLLLPLQLDGFPTREVIKRRMPNDTQTLSESRYHSRAQIRILIDDENPAFTDASGIPTGQGVRLSTFDPIPLPNAAKTASGGRALWRINDSGNYTDTATTCMRQAQGSTPGQAMTVRGVKAATQNVTLHGTATKIPGGSGITGRILIQIIDDNGVARDVTTEILSMGMTEGEPNAIVYLQRPLWAAFTQGARDASGGTNFLNSLLFNAYGAADGEIQTSPAPVQDSNYGHLTAMVDDTLAGQPTRADVPPSNSPSTLISQWGTGSWATNKNWNAIVPVNLYNVREGSINGSCDSVWERGLTSVVSVNMRNLARWIDGVYDATLLNGTPAVSTNIAKPDGYTIYVSDRRGDKVRAMVDYSGANINSSNGMVDNLDIYGPNNSLDAGEDVQGFGTLVKDTTECPDPAVLSGAYGTDATKRGIAVAAWTNPSNYFRRGVRLVNAENLQITGGANKISSTLGITMASENMVYLWGNYNTTGINTAPPDGTSSLNDPTQTYHYLGNQVPASIVCDAIFPLSKTWYDAITAMYPNDLSKRKADRNLPGATAETAIRAAIIAGNNLGALAGTPNAGNDANESRLNGGMHNFPRFLEDWDARWNFVGSLVPLFNSTQALGQYNADSCHYAPPTRNWAFDSTFLNPNRLPPATPQFQYIQPTAFRQVLY